MSHQPERKERDCLNCGAIINGRYCHVCGQENIVTRQSFWGLAQHFIYDVFHFDGKFFDTLKYLLIRPGKVPKEYVSGKRMKYLDPVRMYLFTSAIFFLVFFSIRDVSKILGPTVDRQMTRPERFAKASEIHFQLEKNPADSVLRYKLGLLLDTTKIIGLEKDTGNVARDSLSIDLPEGHYIMYPETDSSDLKSVARGDTWLERKLNERWKEKKQKYEDDNRKILGDLSSEFMHKLPYFLFISLPIFALILKLLYVRRKNFYYSDHAVFTLYHYIFSFILLLFFFGFDALEKWLHWSVFGWITTALTIFWPVYLLAGMKNFYRQAWGRTLGKFLLVNLLGFITLLLLFILFIILSFVF
ncbi:MAG TPA: DUF3667 domain-containing protein [Flavisolibacter sp.]|nr:DUF3667 domain-containing protein [Flavisolibacter sp.]